MKKEEVRAFVAGFARGWKSRESKLTQHLVPSAEYEELKTLHYNEWAWESVPKAPVQLELPLETPHG